MAVTVTATMSGATANEHIYLQVLVLTGATETGGASVASLNASGGASVTASLTPNFSTSLPCFALTADNWGGTYTAASSNTIDSSSDDPDSWGAGFGRYTGTVTASTPLTFGASGVGGGCDYSTWACYEVPASGGTTPAVDGSSPALASATGSGVKTVTSASFTPPGGAVIAAMVCGGGTGSSGTFTITVTDTGGGLTWTKRAGNATAADQNTAVYTATVGGGALAVTTAALPAAATGLAYSQTLQASGGTSPYTWSVSSGSLPSWASLDTSTGAITGTPSSGQPGSTFTAEVTDSASATAAQSLTLDVHLPVTLVGSVGNASGTSSPLTAVYGQAPTAGSLLLAVVSAGSTTAETPGISTSAPGWSRLTPGSVGNNPSGTCKATVDAWVKTAAGSDAAPTFTQALSGSPELTCGMYELAGADLASPLDVSGVQQTGSGTSTVTFSLATSAAVGAYGEFAVSVMAQERASATLTWTETGSGWTGQGKLPASGSAVLFTQGNSQAAPAPGSALTDGGQWSTRTAALGAGLILVIAGTPVTSVPGTATPAAVACAAAIPGPAVSHGQTVSPAAVTATTRIGGSPVKYITGLGGTGAGYFADNGGDPRMVLGDAAWALPGNAGRWSSGAWQSDFDTFLATRAGQGFTALYTKPIGTTQSGNLDDNGKTFDSLYPFQGASPTTGVAGANPSTGLTSAFWARIDYFLASAKAQGITVFLNAIGYSSDFDSGPGPLSGKSTTEFQAYGAAIGARYAGQQNLIWMVADDYFSDDDAVITAFLTGLRGAGASQPISIENYPETTSRFDASSSTALAWGTANAQYNFCYSYNRTYWMIEKAYLESSPIPVIQGDGYFYQGGSSYAGGSGAFAFDRAIRQDAWHAISSGARGIIHGSEAIWQWPSTAQADAASAWYYAHNAGAIRALMESLPGWQLLVPDTSSALVTAGRGTHATGFTSGGGGGQYEVAFTDSYVTASRVADGSLAVIYLSHGTTITIDETKMVSGYQAFWADPITGATTSATAGTTYNSTAKGNNSQGDPDWVLILRTPAAQDATTTPTAVAGSTSVPAPSLSTGETASPVAIAAAAAIPALVVAAGSVSAPLAVAAAATIPAPSVSTGSVLSPAAVACTASIPGPALSTDQTAAPSAVQAVTTIPGPVIAAGSGVSPAAVSAAATIPAPAVATDADLSPAAVSCSTTVPVPAVGASASPAPGAVACFATIAAPSLSTDSVLSPAAVDCTTAIPAPAVSTGSVVTAPPVACAASVPDPAVNAGAGTSPGAVACAATVPAPSLSTGEDVSPGPVSCTVSIPAPGVSAGGSATTGPPAVACTVTIPAPSVTVTSAADAGPGAVQAAASIPAVTISAAATVAGLAVQVTASIPAAAAVAGQTAAPATVSCTVTVPAPDVTTASGTITSPPAVTCSVLIPAPSLSVSATVQALALVCLAAIAGPFIPPQVTLDGVSASGVPHTAWSTSGQPHTSWSASGFPHC